jgi:hypothetical protein
LAAGWRNATPIWSGKWRAGWNGRRIQANARQAQIVLMAADVNLYVGVLSRDKVLKDARMPSQIFFLKLGI